MRWELMLLATAVRRAPSFCFHIGRILQGRSRLLTGSKGMYFPSSRMMRQGIHLFAGARTAKPELMAQALETAVVELGITASGCRRSTVETAFCSLAFDYTLFESRRENLSKEPWSSRDAWRDFLAEGSNLRYALGALQNGRRRAQDLNEVRQLLELEGRAPRRVEALDVSHSGGQFPVVSCVVIEDGKSLDEGWTWKVSKDVTPGDDCGALAFGVSLRLDEGGVLPDVLLIDGGKAQLRAVARVLAAKKGMHVVALAKGDRQQGVLAMRAGEKLYDLTNRSLFGLGVPRLFRHARDEAHLRALEGHRVLRDTHFLDEKGSGKTMMKHQRSRKLKAGALDAIEREELRRAFVRAICAMDPLYCERPDDIADPAMSTYDHLRRSEMQSRRRDFLTRESQIDDSYSRAFAVTAPYKITAPQQQAVDAVLRRLLDREKSGGLALLKGATGTGKTFCMAHLIARRCLPTLVLAPNKVLAAQLYGELKALMPQNAVEYFVSYYDYYRPEFYVSSMDSYQAKRSSINDQIDALRHRTTKSLATRPDVVVVASISCIYGLGVPHAYKAVAINRGDDLIGVANTLRSLGFEESAAGDEGIPDRGSFSVVAHGSTALTIMPPSGAVAPIELGFDDAHRLALINSRADVEEIHIYPATHYSSLEDDRERICRDILRELESCSEAFRAVGKHVEADRLETRTLADVCSIRETGRCAGIENYSRIISGSSVGDPPVTLLDYFPPSTDTARFLLIVDESHLTIGQLRAAYAGDRARKLTLVENGYRLPSALDNRPLTSTEFWKKVNDAVFVSATPGKHEEGLLCARASPLLQNPEMPAAELVIRPTLICDPLVEVRPAVGQVDNALRECDKRARQGQTSILVALTVASAKNIVQRVEELRDVNLRAEALTGDLKPQKRLEILSRLRAGQLDTIIGVNLLREGINLPVSLICILDADKEGFLRSEASLIQTIGRASRHVRGTALLYASRQTPSMRRAIAETEARRQVQQEYILRYRLQAKPLVWREHNAADALFGTS